jgi:hypothetical protein
VQAAVAMNEAQFFEFTQEKMTRERVVPIISASISCDALAIIFEAGPACQNERATKGYAPAVSRSRRGVNV